MPKVRGFTRTVTFRLAFGYGLLMIASLVLMSVLFYFGTIGVLQRGIDTKLRNLSLRLTNDVAKTGLAGLERQIRMALDDGIDSDTEVYLLESPDGVKVAGNLSSWPESASPFDRLSDQEVIRANRPSLSRLLPRRLSDGSVLVVGRDMQDIREIESLVWRALVTGVLLALQLVVGGAILFRRQIEKRIAAIRWTARRIEDGNLNIRIPPDEVEDEFSRLGRDINHMLDRIQHLMEGVAHVSNAIAHDLRTPLSRIRGRLDEASRPGRSHDHLITSARSAIEAIDDLTGVFDKLLQIAEAESGARRQSFRPVPLAPLIANVVELYDAMAESKGVALVPEIVGDPIALGDGDLLAGAIANLVDNALKYSGKGATVRLKVMGKNDWTLIVVSDDGPGIPENERSKVTGRFYRLDSSRGQPGNGLGLSIVAAVASLHRGQLILTDAEPGLTATIRLPKSFQTVS